MDRVVIRFGTCCQSQSHLLFDAGTRDYVSHLSDDDCGIELSGFLSSEWNLYPSDPFIVRIIPRCIFAKLDILSNVAVDLPELEKV